MIVFRYLTRQVLSSTIAVTFILLLVILSGRFIKYLANVASGDMAANILSLIMLYRLPGFLELILPLGFFLSIMLVYGRMYADSEMVVLFAGGVSRNKLFSYTFVISTFMALIVAYISWVLVPIGNQKFNVIWNDPTNFRGLSTLIEGRFQDNEGTSWVTYTDELSPDKSNLGMVFMAHPVTEEEPREIILVAKNGRVSEQDSGRYIELFEGYRFEGNAGDLNYRITEFDQYGQKMESSHKPAAINTTPNPSMLQMFQSPELEQRALAHWRLGIPISLLIMSLFAFAMSKTDSRRGRFTKLLPAMVIYVLYIFLMSAAKNYLIDGKVPISLGLWWLHGAFLLFTLMIYFAPQWLPSWQRLRYSKARQS